VSKSDSKTVTEQSRAQMRSEICALFQVPTSLAFSPEHVFDAVACLR